MKEPANSTTDSTNAEVGKRERVLSAAFACFNGKGFADTSMLDIAKSAQMSKRDLYALFVNKHAVLAACVGRRTEAMRAPLQAVAPKSGAELATLLVTLGSSILRGVSRPEALMVHRMAIAEADRAPEIARMLDEAGRGASQRRVAELLAQAQVAGHLGAGEPAELSARFFALLWGDLLIRLLMRVREPPDDAEIEARVRVAVAALPILIK